MEQGKSNTDLISNGWFMEKNKQWPGQAFSLEVEKVLEVKQSEFQDIMVFQRYDEIKFFCAAGNVFGKLVFLGRFSFLPVFIKTSLAN